jgi:hypothetical protein
MSTRFWVTILPQKFILAFKKWPNSKISPNLVTLLQSKDSQDKKYATFFKYPQTFFQT